MPPKTINRIEVIASFVDFEANIADIGSDHCKVPILLCKQNKIRFAQAVENKKGPYKRMCKEIEDSGFSNAIKPTLSDGLNDLDECVDTLIIAGMGGKLIISILAKNIKKLANISTIIIDAHNEKYEISSFLMKQGYILADNSFFYDSNKPYDVMKWQKSENRVEYTESELKFGPLNIIRKPQAWVCYWKNEIKRLKSIIEFNELPIEKKNQYIVEVYNIEKAIK